MPKRKVEAAIAIVDIELPKGIRPEDLDLPVSANQIAEDYVVIQYKGETDYKRKKKKILKYINGL